jgi:hypothetical protein
MMEVVEMGIEKIIGTVEYRPVIETKEGMHMDTYMLSIWINDGGWHDEGSLERYLAFDAASDSDAVRLANAYAAQQEDRSPDCDVDLTGLCRIAAQLPWYKMNADDKALSVSEDDLAKADFRCFDREFDSYLIEEPEYRFRSDEAR